ncbi:hypothetical protein HK104_009356 [Borealophlyctis nickersoniae]|nr:hypothetical protein HK104_009356 [Borealophlyctis nickersoniae]
MQFESEISPEDLFNMFFGDIAGTGLRSYTAAPGFRTYSFNAGGGRRRPQQAQPESVVYQIIHMLPLLLLFFLYLSGSLFGGDDEPSFAWDRTGSYNLRQQTSERKIPFYVEPGRAWNKISQNAAKLEKFEKGVEYQYRRHLQYECSREQQIKRHRIAQAQGWFGVDEARLKQAQNMKLPNCEKLWAFDA